MQNKKHILILHPHFTISGGAGRFVIEVGQRLAEKGYKVTVISMQSDRKLTHAAPDVRFIDVKGPLTSSFFFWLLFPFWYWRVSTMIDMLKPDILFPQIFPSQWWALLYKHFHPQIRVVWMCQEPSAFIHSTSWIQAIHSPVKRVIALQIKRFLAPFDIWLAHKADAVIANSKFSIGQIQQTYGIQESKLSVVYPGVSERYIPKKFDGNRKPIVVTVSRLTKFKNIDVLITAFLQFARQQNKQWLFYIVGEGEEKASLTKLVHSLHANEKIQLQGQLTDTTLSKLLVSSTFYLSASIDEPFGISLVEAQASGNIAIAHNSGGPKETIIHNKTGKLVDHLDADLYVEAMTDCLKGQKPAQLSQAAHLHGKTFTWDLTTDTVVSVLFPSEK